MRSKHHISSAKAVSRWKLLSAVSAAAGSVLASTSAEAGIYAWNKTTGAGLTWIQTSPSDNWNYTAGPGGGTDTIYPQVAGDTANLTANITVDMPINLNAAITVGVMSFNDTSNIYSVLTGAGGSLTFNNNGSAATLTVNGAPVGSATGHIINTGISLADNLTITNLAGAPTAYTPGLTLQGTISAASGNRTITVGGVGIGEYNVRRHGVAIESNLSDGAGTLALTHMVGNTTTDRGTTWLSGNNTYTGGTRVAIGNLEARQISGTPFGTGNITINDGRLALTPAGSSGANIAVSGSNATLTTKFNYGHGGGRIAFIEGGHNSLTFTVGNAGAAANSVVTRVGRGTLMVVPTAIGSLGAAAGAAGGERWLVNGGVATTAVTTSPVIPGASMVSPTIIGQTSSSSTVGEFLTYDATDGFKRATPFYTARSGTFTANNGEISDITATAGTVNTANPLAVRVAAITATIATGATLTVGNGSDPAGLLLNGSTINGSDPNTSVLAFGASEAAIYSGSALSQINARITGTGGLTKFGPNTLVLTNLNNTLSGGIVVNNSVLEPRGPATLGAASPTHTITLMPHTELRIDHATNNGATFAHDIILNGSRSVTVSNYEVDEPKIRSGGNAINLSDARILSGVIKDGTEVPTNAAPSVEFHVGATRLQGTNTYTGRTRMRSSLVVAENNSAFGFGDNTSATGIHQYAGSTIGIRGGVTIANEFVSMQGVPGFDSSNPTASDPGGIHAFPGLSASQIATWGGTIDIAASSPIGAEPGTTLLFSRATDSIVDASQAFVKVGAGTVEIAGANVFGTTATSVVILSDGNLRLSNGTTGSATGSASIDVTDNATLSGNGQMSNAVRVQNLGTLAPGASIGTLTLTGTAANNQSGTGVPVQGNLTTAAGAIVQMELSSTAADQINLTKSTSVATINDDITYSVLGAGFTPAQGTIFDLIIADVVNYQGLTLGDVPINQDNLDTLLASYGYTTRVTGANPVNDPAEYKYSIVANGAGSGTLNVLRLELSAIPEPSSAGLAALASLGVMTRRRRRA